VAWEDLAAWAEADDDDIARLRVRRERLHDRRGRALALVDERIEDERTDRELRVAILRELGWRHLAGEEERWLAVRFPPGETVC
jgi:hypothetical protein